MAFSITGVSPSLISGNGGREIQIAGAFELGHQYRAYIGDTGTTADPPCYSGISGQGNVLVTTDITRLLAYAPALTEDLGGHDVLVVDVDTAEAHLLSNVMQVVNPNFGTTVYGLRRVLPPTWKTGPRNIESEQPT